MAAMVQPSSILLIISGSVASYKSLELIRRLGERGVRVSSILTKGGAEFITPMAVSSLSGTQTYTDLFSLTDEIEMGHIELSRSADMVLVAPASANILAKMAAGIADDLATTALLATNKPVFVAPAMNVKMWEHAATKRNIAQLVRDGVNIIMPTEGAMACGEFGVGRMAELDTIIAHIFASKTHAAPLKGKHAIVTAGPTHEPVDPVRFLGNHASGKQGYAIAASLAAAGANVTLITGPTTLATPAGVTRVEAHTAEAMYDATMQALPADIFVGTAAVADWRMAHISPLKIKKHGKISKLTLELVPTRDILHAVATHKKRPPLVIGFAAETDNVSANASKKRVEKNCDWLLANDVSEGKVFGADTNEIHMFTATGETVWPHMHKDAVAQKLVEEIIQHITSNPKRKSA
jgi:phosphopantothenoylcysteine decarboxylase/phosphopantothenate--cysteine ligase